MELIEKSILEVIPDASLTKIESIGWIFDKHGTRVKFNEKEHLSHDAIILDLEVEFSDGESNLKKTYQSWGGIYIADLLYAQPNCCQHILVNSAFLSDRSLTNAYKDSITKLENKKRVLKWEKNGEKIDHLIEHLKRIHAAKKMRFNYNSYSISQMAFASKTDSNVLLLGISGTGKDNYARIIHEEWCKSRNILPFKRPFHPINCSTLPINLLQYLMFGVVRGFDDYTKNKLGNALIAAGIKEPVKEKNSISMFLKKKSNNFDSYINWLEEDCMADIKRTDSTTIEINCENTFGTLFLDEIGEVSSEVQSLLLRFLGRKPEVTPLGFEGKIILSNLRIIAATSNPNWLRMAGINIPQDDSRAMPKPDLFYRLADHRIEVEALKSFEVKSFIENSDFKQYWKETGISILERLVNDNMIKGQRRELLSIINMAGQFVKKSTELGYGKYNEVTDEVINKIWKPVLD